MIGSPYYWAVVAALTFAFAVVDLIALSRRELGRKQTVAVAAYMATWVVIGGLSLPVAPLGSLGWVFPAAVRIAVMTTFWGGQLLAAAFRTEQAVAHRKDPRPPKHVLERPLTEAELLSAEAYDAQWQAEDRARNRERERQERMAHAHTAHPPHRSGDAAKRFEHLVQDAIDGLPADIHTRMSNVAVVVEDEPPSGEHLLGLYRGVPLTRRTQGYSGALPDKITIFRGPLERHYGNEPGRLAHEVKRTVWHEIAHHFGISDERLIEIDRY